MRPPSSRSPREFAEACALVSWSARAKWRGIPLLDLLVMIPNGAYLGASLRGRQITMSKLKAQGFRAGVADYLLPVPIRPLTEPMICPHALSGAAGSPCGRCGNGPCPILAKTRTQWTPGLWLELKRADGVPSDVPPEQRVFMDDMVDLGWDAQVAFGCEHAQEILSEYLARTGSPVTFGYSLASPPPEAWLKRRMLVGLQDALR